MGLLTGTRPGDAANMYSSITDSLLYPLQEVGSGINAFAAPLQTVVDFCVSSNPFHTLPLWISHLPGNRYFRKITHKKFNSL